MSSFHGNSERCKCCKLSYGEFRTGLTYRDVWLMFYTPDGTPNNEWKYKRRGTILGKWYEIKQSLWSKHKSDCKRKRRKVRRRKVPAYSARDFKD